MDRGREFGVRLSLDVTLEQNKWVAISLKSPGLIVLHVSVSIARTELSRYSCQLRFKWIDNL